MGSEDVDIVDLLLSLQSAQQQSRMDLLYACIGFLVIGILVLAMRRSQHHAAGWSAAVAAAQPRPQEPRGSPRSPFAKRDSSSSSSVLSGRQPSRRGAPSMEEVFIEQQERHDAAQSMEPVEILRELMRGNTRFWTGVATRPELSAMERRALIVQQAPKVVIVGCSDSRVPIEIVFDQGLGDVFAIRVAGNTIQRMTKRTAAVAAFTPWVDPVRASIDYAVHKLGCRLILVLGHEGCGAIKAATATKPNKTPKSPRTTSSPFLDDDDDLEGEPPALVALLSTLGDELHKAAPHLDGITDRRSREREAVVTNARLQVERILEDPRLRLKEENDDLLVVASFYEISTGVVEFLDLPERVRIPH